jgi:hypothetical protein
MNLPLQIAGVVGGTSAFAALAAALVGGAAAGFGVCDPKLGCSFGIQFSAMLSGLLGLCCGIVVLCACGGYTAITGRLLSPRATLLLGAGAGASVGTVLAIATFSSYA